MSAVALASVPGEDTGLQSERSESRREQVSWMVYLVIFMVVFNVASAVMMFRRYGRLDRLIDVAKSQSGWVSTWQIEAKFKEEVLESIGLDLEHELETRVDKQVKEVMSDKVKARLDVVSEEFAQKYTQQHFEEHIKAHMSQLVSNNIRAGILRDMTARYESS